MNIRASGTNAICLLLLCVYTGPALADAEPAVEAKRALTLADYGRTQFPGTPQISPDGQQIAFELNYTVFVTAVGDTLPRPISSSSASAWNPVWSADGKYIYVISDLTDTYQLWKLPANRRGRVKQVTRLKHGLSSASLSPDETQVLLSYSDQDLRDEDDDAEPKPVVITSRQFKRDSGNGYVTADQTEHLYIYDIATRSLNQLTSGKYTESGAAWSPDGRSVVFVSNREDDADASFQTDLWTIAIDYVGEVRPLNRLTDNSSVKQSPSWSPDGKQIAYLTAEDGVYSLPNIAIIPAAGGDARILTTSLDRWITSFEFSADGDWIYFSFDNGGASHLARVQVQDETIEVLLNGDISVSAFDIGATDALAVAFNNRNDDTNIYKLHQGHLTQLTDISQEYFSELRVGEKLKVSFESKDGTVIEAFITTPADYRPERKYPTVLKIHGGPVGQFTWGYDFATQYLAANGYVVVEPNPRGSSGRGQDFVRAIYRNWGVVDYDDVIAAAEYAVAKGYSDPERMAVTGYSYGGYMTNVIITQTKRFKAAASGAGHSLIAANVGHDIYQQWYTWELGVPWENREKYDKLSPLLRAGNVVTPTIFLGGRIDWNVPILNAELFYQALKMKGVDSQLVVYPDTHHGEWSEEFEKDYLQRVVAWFDHYVKSE